MHYVTLSHAKQNKTKKMKVCQIHKKRKSSQQKMLLRGLVDKDFKLVITCPKRLKEAYLNN